MKCWQISLRIAKQRLRWWPMWHWQDVRAARCAIVGDHGAVARCIWVYCYRGILGLVQFVDSILETFERKDASGPEASDNVLFFILSVHIFLIRSENCPLISFLHPAFLNWSIYKHSVPRHIHWMKNTLVQWLKQVCSVRRQLDNGNLVLSCFSDDRVRKMASVTVEDQENWNLWHCYTRL